MKLLTKMMSIALLLVPLSAGHSIVESCPVLSEAKYEIRSAIVEYTASRNSTLNASRKSTFRIITEESRGMAIGTATLFLYKGKQIVITAAHVVSNADRIYIESRYEPEVERELTLVYYDELFDLAVLIPNEKIETISAIKLRPAKTKHMTIGTKTIYSGYPNNQSMLTINGSIAGFTSHADLVLDTYGWKGASGSAVFDERGRLLGILSAMDIGNGMFGMPTLIPNVITVAPITRIQFDILDSILDK